jgi:serine/threonine protein kinase
MILHIVPPSPGTRLDGYEVLGPLGAGGMGEVYRTRDSLLKREVAIKVLPPFVSQDPDRLHRFQQQAEAAAALNRLVENPAGHALGKVFRATGLRQCSIVLT